MLLFLFRRDTNQGVCVAVVCVLTKHTTTLSKFTTPAVVRVLTNHLPFPIITCPNETLNNVFISLLKQYNYDSSQKTLRSIYDLIG